MIEYLTPGVYFQETPVDQTLVPVSTATGGFVGFAPDGCHVPPHTAVVVENWSQFCEQFGNADGNPYVPGCYLAHAVRGFFSNGGTRAFVVRVPLFTLDRARQFYQWLVASQLIRTTAHPWEEFLAWTEEAESPLEHANAWPLLSLWLRGAQLPLSEIAAWRNFCNDPAHVGVLQPYSHWVERFQEWSEAANLQFQEPDVWRGFLHWLQYSNVPTRSQTHSDEYSVSSLDLRERFYELLHRAGLTLPALDPWNHAAAWLEAEGVTLLPEDLERLVPAADPLAALAQPLGFSCLRSVDEVSFVAVPDLMAGMWYRDRLRPTPLGRCPYCGGRLNGPVERCYQCKRRGPELVRVEARDARREAIRARQQILVEACEHLADRVAVLDSLPGLSTLEIKAEVSSANFPCKRGFAALYYPWVQTQVAGTQEDRMAPPCGHALGVWARTDVEQGVHLAPANREIEEVLDVERPVTEGEQHLLNPWGVNCIRAFPGRGVQVWGARTLASDSSWKYLNVRRLMTFIEKSIDRNTQWAVFEPNDPALWERITRFVEGFLTVLWRNGQLAGEIPEQAFRVRCNAETNPTESVLAGRIITEIWVAPLRPAEFIAFRVHQWHGAGMRG